MKKSELKELVREVLVETQEETTVESITRSDLKDMIKEIISEGKTVKVPTEEPHFKDPWWADKGNELIEFATKNKLWPRQYEDQKSYGRMMQYQFDRWVKQSTPKMAWKNLLEDLENWIIFDKSPNKAGMRLPNLPNLKKTYGGRFDPKLEAEIEKMIDYAYENFIIDARRPIYREYEEEWDTPMVRTTKEVFEKVVVNYLNKYSASADSAPSLNSLAALKKHVARRDDFWEMTKYIKSNSTYTSADFVEKAAWIHGGDGYMEKYVDRDWFNQAQAALSKQGIDIDMQKVRKAWWQGNGLKVLKSLLKND